MDNDNAYAQIIKAVSGEGEESKELSNIGIVSSINPLKVKVGSLELDKDNLIINPNLLPKEITIDADAKTEQASTADHPHGHGIKLKDQKVNIKYKDKINLAIGDEVAIIRQGQLFIILCKVVSL